MRWPQWAVVGGIAGVAVIALGLVVVVYGNGYTLIVAVFGAVVFGAIGVVATAVAVGVRAALVNGEHQLRARQTAAERSVPFTRGDLWQQLADACADHVHKSGEAIVLASPFPAIDRLVALQERMTAELAKVDTLARLARSQFPNEPGVPSPRTATHPLYHQLRQAEAAFARSRSRVVGIVLMLPHRPDFHEVDAELLLLAADLPVVAEPELT
ncbi:MAG TPA: hypothetical protein VGG05_20100 [Pseudonocardiaceae bacterium]|jgi:hypothetical protein